MMSIKIPGASNGLLNIGGETYPVCTNPWNNYQWTSINGATNVATTSWPSVCADPDLGTMFVHVQIRTSDNIPLIVWQRSDNLYINVNSNTAGTGTYTETAIRTVSGQNSVGAYNSFRKLSNNGYGVYYQYIQSVSGSPVYNWAYSYTTNTAGTSGWVHQTLFAASSAADIRMGVVGVDGVGRVFIAHSGGSGGSVIVRRGADASGTSFTLVATLTIHASCTRTYVLSKRSVLLSGSFPAFLAICQNNDIYFVRSTTTSAVGPWVVEFLTPQFGGLSADAFDTRERFTSLNLSGNGYPHLAYFDGPPLFSGIHWIQSTQPNSFYN